MRRYYVTCFCLIALASASGFSSDSTKLKLGYKNYVGVGFRFIDGLGNLNTSLKSISYPQLSNVVSMITFGLSFNKGRGNFGAHYNALLFPVTKTGNISNTAIGIGSEFRYTYDLIRRDRYTVYPMMGFATQLIKVSHKFTNEVSFTTATTNPQVDPLGRTELLKLRDEEILGSIGLGCDRIIKRHKTGKTAFSLSLQMAYYFSLDQRWDLNNQVINTKGGVSGVELRLVLAGIRFPQKR